MTIEQFTDVLTERLRKARIAKSNSYDAYCDCYGDQKWKLKMAWQEACRRVRELSLTIMVINAEKAR